MEQIAALIRRGDLSPGEPLPSARELGAQLLVAPSTAERAYADLGALGLVTPRAGRPHVAEHFEPVPRLQALGQAREALSGAIAFARALGFDGEVLRAFILELLAQQGHKTHKEKLDP